MARTAAIGSARPPPCTARPGHGAPGPSTASRGVLGGDRVSPMAGPASGRACRPRTAASGRRSRRGPRCPARIEARGDHFAPLCPPSRPARLRRLSRTAGSPRSTAIEATVPSASPQASPARAMVACMSCVTVIDILARASCRLRRPLSSDNYGCGMPRGQLSTLDNAAWPLDRRRPPLPAEVALTRGGVLTQY